MFCWGDIYMASIANSMYALSEFLLQWHVYASIARDVTCPSIEIYHMDLELCYCIFGLYSMG